MCSLVGDGERRDKKEKKRKREAGDEQNAVELSSVKKEKKKRQKEEAEKEDKPTESGTVKKDKKKKRKKGEENGSTETDGPTRISDSSKSSAAVSHPTPSDAPSATEVNDFLTKHAITIHTPDDIDAVVPILSFSQLAIPSGLSSAFSGFKEPTPVQACTWPPALQGRDVVGIAETGSGKTLAFGLPALARILSSPPEKKGKSTVTTLVVAPTRELAIQTHDTLFALGAQYGIASVAVFGGVDKAPQVKTLANANKDGKITRIIVGTPGRILDLANDGVCDLSRVNYLVLDEADRMLDKGFENDIRAIISRTLQGAERQTMMFSATWPEAVRRLASTFQRNPVRVTVGSDDLTANSRVEQFVEVFDDVRDKDSRLLERLRSLSHKKISKKGSDEARILIFALYKKEASRVEGTLRRHGYDVGALHGDMSQSARMEALDKFKTGETGLLVATDVAARGLDIPNVGTVINYTFPLTIEDYIHRIGRTGRGGRTGRSITFFTGDNHERALAGELARVLRESGFDNAADGLKSFPMTIKKKTHGAYGAFFRDDITAAPSKIVF
ncbi:hypothetical protein SERLADRAFT_352582 [Serpula lacrymans var. lacrymans S7.9]|uniref:RNA helicase n=1 Tax=Serpula lacrymans var. lacrymans (strain S7.9) TaxID=578457 RepID=F8PB35_SERL9|nr:uncharacterized protein SERLADRAFT_352582 [Serpula lacrymans var. lacrymans S7.9]EGO19475.1 hypothetical protein SERLADRAFT_352582 [Serpula lacrymans var. lacrymans S7.9]